MHNCTTSAGTPPRTPLSHALRLPLSEPARPLSLPRNNHMATHEQCTSSDINPVVSSTWYRSRAETDGAG